MAQLPPIWGGEFGSDTFNYELLNRQLMIKVPLEPSDYRWPEFENTFIQIDKGLSRSGAPIFLYKLTKGSIQYNVFQYANSYFYIPWFIVDLREIVSCEEAPHQIFVMRSEYDAL